MKNNKSKIIKIILATIISIILCFTIYQIATYNKTYYISQKNIEIPIFLYHDIVENKDQIEFDYMRGR